MRLRRYVLTGAPGSGKTTLLRALGERGHEVVPEAASDVIKDQQARGTDKPWEHEGFVDLIVALQRRRQLRRPSGPGRVQLYDRSPLCTLALARYLGQPVTHLLAREVAHVLRERAYQPTVFLVRPLGFIEPTSMRRISYPDSLEFEKVHEAVYREHGFHLLDVPCRPTGERVTVVEAQLAADMQAV